tara:strand:+ start:1692 stop:2972 length:1281 start_codon:yes stop_codon:yes gene_type:complete
MKKVLKLKTEFEQLVYRADEILIACAMITEKGLQAFSDRQDEAIFQVLVGIDLPTQPSSLQKMLDEDIEVKIYKTKGHFFHPKVYLFRIDDEWTVIVGSGNCTEGGINGNIEMSIKIEDDDIAEDLAKWFDMYFKLGIKLTQEWLDDYAIMFASRRDLENELHAKVEQFKNRTGISRGNRKLEDYDYENQFFQYEHYNAFTGQKPVLNEPAFIAERVLVMNRLLDLNDLLYPEIRMRGWKVYTHGMDQHTTSSPSHKHRAERELTAIWLHYGRDEDEIEIYKQLYGDNMTSLYHMRLQALIDKNDFTVELRVGKNNGSYPDREHIKKQLKTNPTFLKKYYQLVQDLDDEFDITINNEYIKVRDFEDAEHLKEFTVADNPKLHYFRIGRPYKPDDKAISNDNIISTIMADFEKLYPLYQLFKHTIKA